MYSQLVGMDLQVFGPRNPNGFTDSCLKWFCRSRCDNDILLMIPNHRLSTKAVLPWVAEGEKQPHFLGSLQLPDRSHVGVDLFSQETSETTRGKYIKFHKGQFRLDMRKNFFKERVVNHWIRLLRAVVG